MRRPFLCVLLLACASMQAARAETEDAAFAWREPDAEALSEQSSSRSPLAALALSFTATALPIGAAAMIEAKSNGANGFWIGTLTTAGIFLGPSVGQFYAGAPGQGLLGIGIRGAGAALFVYGIVESLGDIFCSDGNDNGIDGSGSSKQCGSSGGIPLMIGGLTYLGGFVYSFIDGALAAERYNDAHAPPHFGFAPTLLPQSDGGLKAGASAWMHF